MKAGVGAVIASVVYDMGSGVVKTGQKTLILIMILAFIADYFLQINVVYIIITVIIIGVLRTVVREKRCLK